VDVPQSVGPAKEFPFAIGGATDRATGYAPLTDVSAFTMASTLTWMSERIYYLAAIGHPAFRDEQQVIDVLTDVWLSVIYNGPPSTKGSK